MSNMPTKKDKNPKLEEAKIRASEAVIDMLKLGCSYFDIEEVVADAILYLNGDSVYCDIHR